MSRWSAIRRGRGDLPPIVDGLEFFGDLSSANTSIVSGAVATLGDSSGNGRHFTQATSTKRPTYTAIDSNFGGRPSMTGDGVDDGLIAGSAFQPSRSSLLTQYIVCRVPTLPAACLYGLSVGVSGGYSIRTATGNLEAYYSKPASANTTYNAALGAPATIRIAVSYDITTGATAIADFRINNTSGGSYVATLAGDGGPFATNVPAIFSINAAASFSNATIADILVYSGSHTSAQKTTIDDWLKWRNGL